MSYKEWWISTLRPSPTVYMAWSRVLPSPLLSSRMHTQRFNQGPQLASPPFRMGPHTCSVETQLTENSRIPVPKAQSKRKGVTSGWTCSVGHLSLGKSRGRKVGSTEKNRAQALVFSFPLPTMRKSTDGEQSPKRRFIKWPLAHTMIATENVCQSWLGHCQPGPHCVWSFFFFLEKGKMNKKADGLESSSFSRLTKYLVISPYSE